MKARKFLATTAALAGLLSAQAASAQAATQTCVKQDDLADAVVFTMPIAYAAFTEKCSGQLASDGFMAREGDAFISQYTALQDDTWPGAYAFFKTFAAKEGEDDAMAELFESLPIEVMQPFFELMIQSELSKAINVKDCSQIERVAEPLAPLPPENLGTLVATLFDLIPDIEDPKICPIETQ